MNTEKKSNPSLDASYNFIKLMPHNNLQIESLYAAKQKGKM
jgi:hypothetical protein